MRLPVDPGFVEERERFALRFCCEDCAYLDEREGCCAHGWPNAEHRLARYDGGQPEELGSPHRGRRSGRTELVFCKEFELR